MIFLSSTHGARHQMRPRLRYVKHLQRHVPPCRARYSISYSNRQRACSPVRHQHNFIIHNHDVLVSSHRVSETQDRGDTMYAGRDGGRMKRRDASMPGQAQRDASIDFDAPSQNRHIARSRSRSGECVAVRTLIPHPSLTPSPVFRATPVLE